MQLHRGMLAMPRSGKFHALGWAIDHVMSAPNIRAKTQAEIAEIATRGGYDCDSRLVGTYMRNWPYDENKPDRNNKPRSKPPFGFVWGLIRGGDLTNEQALELTDAWLEIHPEDERDDLRNFCSVFSYDQASSGARQDMLDLESRNDEPGGGEHERSTGDSSRT